ncbi:hypothetical protein [Aeromicrobium stalagmiti]|uniref:hypothetical protein n=1 Tax=Aeromicrobium stalagmiti TaxID=2738988 RepID=UPI001567F5CE|nr:hypothetical protein [Aeromicrobium stalagmiti]NRQ51108.1 hypothetical protein [Aeromicrobium stalagmiti]
MPNVVTPFMRKKKHGTIDPADARHRRDGWFDEQDNWHDAESQAAATADGTTVR